jgi:hypothetical protein
VKGIMRVEIGILWRIFIFKLWQFFM